MDLKEMMIERFQAWEGKEIPPAVLFYRDSLVYESPSVQSHDTKLDGKPKRTGIIEEMAAIKAAYRRVFKSSLKELSYVLVNSDTIKKTVLYGTDALQPRTYFTTEANEHTAKYVYRVFEDNDSEDALRKTDFADLVSATLCFLVNSTCILTTHRRKH
jgi:hypothetical protein